ncbi:A disintegrin and metalloproteinase with thrombospondin motifs 9-like [Diaphorina citri]|uniref:A disintegrin and metalloproteinase with thrombospondin motifs 9-like n=1 Tax=Diaphorina citri TaxID=121845 RepID=A0A3Q0JHY4_DIACI|nr:A disintegrin and metalloproteinase with thrombospondin motifs 9-like [Diaphorina citri]
MARRDPVCIRIEDNAGVADHMCPSEEDRPEPEMKPCNNHCILKWQVISQSECSAHCGPGTRSVSLQCVQHFPASSQPPQPLHNATCADLPRPAEREPCEGPCNAARWKFSPWGGDNACKLYCRVAQSSAYYLLKDKVIDGTPCGPDTFDVCINGKCMKAGCNHVLDSDSKLDFCGVCEGNNQTCQEIRGSHNTSQYGYTRVLRIPAGSSNLDITQYGYGGTSSDDNYLGE